MEAKGEGAFSDARPFLSLFGEKAGLPDWVLSFFDAKGLRERVDLLFADSRLSLRALEADGRNLRIRGRMDVTENVVSALLLTVHRFSAAMRVRGAAVERVFWRPARARPQGPSEVTAPREPRSVVMKLRNVWILVKAAASSWVDDYAQSMGAALAYYTMFSIAPLLLIVISIAGLIFGVEAARGEIVGQLQGLMGQQGAEAIQGLLESLNKPAEGVTAMLVGGVLLLIGSTTVFGELQDALDRIWRAPKRKMSGVWSLLRARLLSFGMVMGAGFLLMVSLVVSAALAALGRWWGPLFADWEVLANVVDILVSFAFATTVFAMIYKTMPRVKVKWADVWIGAGVTALLFTIGKFLIGLYIGKSGVTSGFGAAGSLVVVLVWVYYSAQIFLMGAEFTWAYANTFGSRKEQPVPAASPAVPSPGRQEAARGEHARGEGSGGRGGAREGEGDRHAGSDKAGLTRTVGRFAFVSPS